MCTNIIYIIYLNKVLIQTVNSNYIHIRHKHDVLKISKFNRGLMFLLI